MRTRIIMIVTAFALSSLLTSAEKSDEIITREGQTVIVNTTELGKNIIGYETATPVKIYIQSGKVVKVEALPNGETPKYFARVKRGILTAWDGKSINKAEKLKVDAVTGATYSSESVIQNVKLGLQYYKKNGKKIK